MAPTIGWPAGSVLSFRLPGVSSLQALLCSQDQEALHCPKSSPSRDSVHQGPAVGPGLCWALRIEVLATLISFF